MINIERNITLDYFKLLLALFVIAIHLPIFNKIPLLSWEISNGIARVAVPIFFIINGYFLQPNVNNPSRMKKYLYKLILLYFVWQIIYLPYSYDPDLKMFFKTLLFGYRHLWYVSGMIGGTVLLYLVKKTNISDKLILLITCILFFIGYILIHLTPYLQIARSFLFVGFPFIFLGYYIKEHNIECKSFVMGKYLFITTVILLIGLFVESFLAYKGIWAGQFNDFYLILFPLCPFIFLCVLKNSQFTHTDSYISNLSGSLYFIHIFVINILFSLNLSDFRLFIVVVFVSLLLSACLIALNKRIKIFL